MSFLAVSEAAERLGVSTRQVQHLVARGELRSLARGVVDETSVERLLTVRRGSRARAWVESTAWAAVALLSGARRGGWGRASGPGSGDDFVVSEPTNWSSARAAGPA